MRRQEDGTSIEPLCAHERFNAGTLLFKLLHGESGLLPIASSLHALIARRRCKEMTLSSPEIEIKRARTLREYFVAGFIEAHKRRPRSFYLLMLIPLVLLLGVHMADLRDSPRRFALVLSVLFLFFWVISAWALNDFFRLYRKHRADQRAAYMETLGDRAFVEKLGKQGRDVR